MFGVIDLELMFGLSGWLVFGCLLVVLGVVLVWVFVCLLFKVLFIVLLSLIWYWC